MFLALILAACDPAPPAADPATAAAPAAPIQVRLALNWYPEPEFGGFYEGVLGGHYAAAGFDVEVIPGGPGAPTLELLTAGRAEAAITAADDLLVKRGRGVQAIGVWPAFQLAPNGLMAHSASGVASYEDIRAGRIAIEVGSPFQEYLWASRGWSGAVKTVPYGGSVGPFLVDEALIQQAYITSEPCVARAQGAEVVFLKASDAGWNPYGSLLALSDPLPPWAADFVAATQTAWAAYLEAPARANAEITGLNDQMKPGLMDCITEAQRPFVVGDDGLGAMTAARWSAMARALGELGLLPEGVDPAAHAREAWRDLSR